MANLDCLLYTRVVASVFRRMSVWLDYVAAPAEGHQPFVRMSFSSLGGMGQYLGSLPSGRSMRRLRC